MVKPWSKMVPNIDHMIKIVLQVSGPPGRSAGDTTNRCTSQLAVHLLLAPGTRAMSGGRGRVGAWFTPCLFCRSRPSVTATRPAQSPQSYLLDTQVLEDVTADPAEFLQDGLPLRHTSVAPIACLYLHISEGRRKSGPSRPCGPGSKHGQRLNKKMAAMPGACKHVLLFSG